MRETDRRKKGFTLAELLLTIGIMVILAGISFVGLTHYQRKLKLLEMDGTAEELFMAAQNEMSTLEANGTLELLSEADLGIAVSSASSAGGEDAGADDSDSAHRCYALIHNAGDNAGGAGEGLLSYLLPFGVIDDTVRTDGNYRIEYDYTAKAVTAVYYSKAASFLSGSGDAYTFKTDGSDAAALKKAAGDRNLRQHFNGTEGEAAGGAIVGYYGGGSKTVPEGSLTAPVLSVENGARLLLHIRMPEANTGVNTVLYVKGRESGAVLTAALGDLSNVVSATLTKTSFSAAAQGQAGSSLYMARMSADAGKDREYLLCLDSVTEQDAHFAALFPSLTPGEDIEIYAKCSSTDGYALEVQSNTVSTNSLFAAVETETVSNAWTFDSSGMGSLKESGAESLPAAMIANVRHLENLDPAVSGLSTDTSDEHCIQAAVQTGDLVYAETAPVTDYDGQAVQTSDTVNTAEAFTTEIAAYSTAAAQSGVSIYDLNGNVSRGYRPIQNDALLSYDGRGNAMVNFDSEDRGQGIFAGISGQRDARPASIRDLRLLNCRFRNAEGAAVGALVGVVGDSHQLILQGIETENCQLSSAGNVGGLIGTVEAGGTDSAAVKLYVNECGSLGEYGSVNGSNAGGLIGSLRGSAETKISNSTASVYVTGSGNAGGFIGEIRGQAELRFSYVGGHTKDGKYPEDSTEGTETGAAETTGQGRWNVMSAAGNAGGFIGAADSVNLNLIGCYTTASVQSAVSAGAFLAAVSGSGSESASYCYAAGKVSGSNQLPETVKNLAAEGKDYTGKSYAKPYDEALKTNGANPQYPYQTAAELFASALADTAVPEVTGGSRSLKYGGKHIGDFCPEEKGAAETFLRFLNGPRLYAEVFTPLKEGVNYLTVVLTGTAEKDAAKENLNCFQFSAERQADRTVKLTRLASPNSAEKHMQYNRAGIVSAAGKDYLVYRILLDDISVSYMHFADITKDIRVGSNITGYAAAELKAKEDTWYTEEQYQQSSVDTALVNQLLPAANTDLHLKGSASSLEKYDWDSESTAVYDSDNSLFGRNSSPLNAENSGHTAYILSCRHLENLDHYVSQLENIEGKRDNAVKLPTDVDAFSYRKAVQQCDLDWDRYIAAVGENGTEFCIYKPSSDTAVTGSGYFYGIQNLLLEEYDGGCHSISNLRMQGDKNDYNTAGLFAAVPSAQQSNLSICNLELRNVMSCLTGSNSSKKNSAAALIGYYGSSKGLTIRNVVISGAEVQADMDAGGLLGLADGSGTIAIQNCAVYEGEKAEDGTRPYKLLISSVGGKSGRNNSTEGSASAGGLIGRIPSNTSLSVGISGCSVYGETALILAKGTGTTDSNTDDSAGGLVGTILSGNLAVDNCGVAAYVYGPGGDCTGGLVGDFSANGSIKNCYVGALTYMNNNSVSFRSESALSSNSLTLDESKLGGYNIYGHLATGGLVGYCSGAVSIENCFMNASVSAVRQGDHCYVGGLLGQLGKESGGHLYDSYVAGKLFEPVYNTYYMGSVVGYSMKDIGNYFNKNSSEAVKILSVTGIDTFVGNKTYVVGCSEVQNVNDLKDANQTATSTETFNSILTGAYPLKTWTQLYTPAEILRGSSDLNSAPLHYIGDWCF